MLKNPAIYKIALFIALLIHAVGLFGILLAPYKDWFVEKTFFNLLLMAVLLIATHKEKNKNFLLFLIITFIAGFGIEVLGVNTGAIFGSYTYNDVLGIQFFNVPLLIGLNWCIIIYCTGMFTTAYENYMLRKLNENGLSLNNRLKMISFMFDATLLAVFFDWIMEPVAIKLGYWQWQSNVVPFYNYISWVIVSALLLAVFKKLNTGRRNIFAVHLFIIQVLFFLVLRTFL